MKFKETSKQQLCHVGFPFLCYLISVVEAKSQINFKDNKL